MHGTRKRLATFSLTNAPASEATAVLFDTSKMATRDYLDEQQAHRFVLNLKSSHVSADKGVIIETSEDRGTTWDTYRTLTYRTAAALFRRSFRIESPDVRVRYTNSAATLTTFTGSLVVYDGSTTSDLCGQQQFAIFRAKAAVTDDTAPAKAASKAGETIIIPDGKRLHFFLEVLTAADAEVADGTADVQFCRYDPGSTYWLLGSDGKRVGCGHRQEFVYDGTGEVWPMLTAHVGTSDAKVNIWGYVEP